MGIKNWLATQLATILTKEDELTGPSICDFDRIRFEIRPCDVLLLEGRSRVSDVIKTITLSPWTHAFLYIGKLNDIEDKNLRKFVEESYVGKTEEQLIIESLLGEGVIISPLSKYGKEHLRICRPKDLSPADAQKVTAHAISYLGCDYNVRQLLDLARFMLPYGIIPRSWRSTLFERNIGDPTRAVCSTMLAECFAAVHFPILPKIEKSADGKIKMYKCNSMLVTPKDFDFSPYFNIIKYPFLGLDTAIYRNLPWDREVIYNPETKTVESD